MEPGDSQWWPMTGQEAMGTNWNTGKSVLNRRKIFTVRVIKHWNRLPREVVKSLSLQILKTQLGMVLSNLL